MEKDLLTTDLPLTSSYMDGQSKAECPKLHSLLEPTAEKEESIPLAFTYVHRMIGMHVGHTIK